MVCGASRESLHVSTFTIDQSVGGLIPLGSPQDADGFAGSGDTSDASRFGARELLVVAEQDGLVQNEGGHSTHQTAAQVDIAGLENGVALAFTLVVTRVVAPTDQSRATEYLSCFSIISWITDRGGQTGSLNSAHALKFCPDLVRGLGNEFSQTLFE